ncbi:hypothetical protein V1525DRAFT_398276 [Lipomyces kononenkoae]|uniref:Uncharacterized protein n=1 Tax=Lipomyces kononenkoae TaxID=34357 RepID=A0ACC3T6C3_LIPKO
MFEETDVADLKSWLIRRLENISDADSEILSDYVLALLRHDQPAEDVKRMCLEQLEDFLHEHNERFVDDVFAALTNKSYLPASKIPTPASAAQVRKIGPDQGVQQSQPNEERQQYSPAYGNQPQQKQQQRQEEEGGVGPTQAQEGTTPGFSNVNPPQAPAFQRFSRALGQMGQQAGDYQSWRQNAATGRGVVQMKKGRCRSYDEQGYCMKGDMCPYEHGEERIIVSGTQAPGSQRRINQKVQHGGRRRAENAGFVSGPSMDANNTTLVVEKIPDENFSLEQIRSVFEAFAPVQDISLDLERNSAVVSFFTHEDAVKAWSSPAPVFQNRFVKVFWKRTDAEVATRGRTHNNHAMSKKRSGSEAPEIDVAEITQRQAEKQREYEERMAKKREYEEKMTEVKRQSEELRQKQEQEREALLAKIRQREESDRANRGESIPSSDGGMEVDSGSLASSSTTEALKSKLEQLKAEAAMLGVSVPESESPVSPYYAARGGRGSFRSRGRSSYRGAYSFRGRAGGLPVMNTARSNLDLRTKKVAVLGLRDSAMESFAGYLLGVGEYENIEPHPTQEDAKVVTFKDRATAEKFYYAGPEIAEVGNVKYSWYNPPAPAPTNVAASLQNADTEMDDDEEEFRQNNQAAWNGNGGGVRVGMANDDDGDVY